MQNLTPSLAGAFLRVERAQRHFYEFEELLSRFRKAEKDKVIVEQDPHIPKQLNIRIDDSLVVPTELSLPVSDCIHNLRASLDYLVFELALLDSGQMQEGTQFPIEDKPETFNKRRRDTYLCGLCDDHVRLIEALQPYKGVEWTKTLRTISNPDKHRRLTAVKPEVAGMFMSYPAGTSSDFQFQINGATEYLKKDQALDVGFADFPAPVTETLNSLLIRVRSTLTDFDPAFQGITA